MKAILERVGLKAKKGAVRLTKPLFLECSKETALVYTQVVKNCSASELLPILEGIAVLQNSTIYSDSWAAYDGLVDFGAKAHYRVKHNKGEFAKCKNHINSIENFWGYAKTRLAKFRGLEKETFWLHLKERQFRYNAKVKGKDLYKILLGLIRNKLLKLDLAYVIHLKFGRGRIIEFISRKIWDMQKLFLRMARR